MATVDATITVGNLKYGYDWTSATKPSGLDAADHFSPTNFNAAKYPSGPPAFGQDTDGTAPQAFLYSQDLGGGNSQIRVMLNGLDDPTTADNGIESPLGANTVAYRTTVQIRTFGQWEFSDVFHTGHGANKPERLIYQDDPLLQSTGFTSNNGLLTTADLDGISEPGETTSGTSMKFIGRTKSADFIYETVGREGAYQTFALSGVTFFNPVPEPSTSAVLSLSLGLILLKRRKR